MKVVVLYGPPAAGKLTVAKELASRTGYVVVDNHKILDLLAPLFPFNNQQLGEVRNKLQKKIYDDILRAIAESDSNIVITSGIATAAGLDNLSGYGDLVTSLGGSVYFVQLRPDKEALLSRVESGDRENKIRNRDHLITWLENHPNAYDVLSGIEHLQIDNSELSPKEVATRIVEEYEL